MYKSIRSVSPHKIYSWTCVIEELLLLQKGKRRLSTWREKWGCYDYYCYMHPCIYVLQEMANHLSRNRFFSLCFHSLKYLFNILLLSCWHDKQDFRPSILEYLIIVHVIFKSFHSPMWYSNWSFMNGFLSSVLQYWIVLLGQPYETEFPLSLTFP